MIFLIFSLPFTSQWHTSTMICTSLRDLLLLPWNSKSNTAVQKPVEILMRSRVQNILIYTPILCQSTLRPDLALAEKSIVNHWLEIYRVNPKYLWGFTFPIWDALGLQCWVYHKYSALTRKHIIYFLLISFYSPFSSPGTTNGLRSGFVFLLQRKWLCWRDLQRLSQRMTNLTLRAEDSCSHLVSCVSPGIWCLQQIKVTLNENQFKGSVGCCWRFPWLGPSNLIFYFGKHLKKSYFFCH